MPETSYFINKSLLRWLFKSISSELGGPFLKAWWQMASCVGVRAVISQRGHWYLWAGLFWWQLAVFWLVLSSVTSKQASHWGPPLQPVSFDRTSLTQTRQVTQGIVLVAEGTKSVCIHVAEVEIFWERACGSKKAEGSGFLGTTYPVSMTRWHP